VLGDDPQRAALAGPSDDERQVLLDRLRLEPSVLQLEMLALERRRLLRPEAPHDPARLVEHVHPHADARKWDSVLVVLELEPGGAHSELQPPAGHVVDRRGHLRHHRGVPIGHAQDEHRAANAARVSRHRGEQRQPLELRPARVRMDRIEVVEVRDPVVPELLAPEP
jgi:hypothetical protein